MITATEVGRDLHITVSGVDEAFVIHPLPGKIGRQVTATYLAGAMGGVTAEAIEDAMRIAVDGGVFDDAADQYVPRPEAEQHVWNRIADELRTAEGESIILPALYWQTVLGIAGVNAFIQGGEGLAGQGKALQALVARLGLSASTTSPNSALEALIQSQVSSRTTTTLRAGVKPGKQPQDRRPPQNPQ